MHLIFYTSRPYLLQSRDCWGCASMRNALYCSTCSILTALFMLLDASTATSVVYTSIVFWCCSARLFFASWVLSSPRPNTNLLLCCNTLCCFSCQCASEVLCSILFCNSLRVLNYDATDFICYKVDGHTQSFLWSKRKGTSFGLNRDHEAWSLGEGLVPIWKVFFFFGKGTNPDKSFFFENAWKSI